MSFCATVLPELAPFTLGIGVLSFRDIGGSSSRTECIQHNMGILKHCCDINTESAEEMGIGGSNIKVCD